MSSAEKFPFYQFARLVRQAHLEGASFETLRMLIEEASARGAALALARCGLEDSKAGSDIGELRGLLEAWRDSKRTARRALVRWCICALLLALTTGVAIKARFLNLP